MNKCVIILTHWGRGKMDAISQTTSSSAFSWMKMFEFRLKISMKFVPKGPINNNPALNQLWLVSRRIYASPGLNASRVTVHLYFSGTLANNAVWTRNVFIGVLFLIHPIKSNASKPPVSIFWIIVLCPYIAKGLQNKLKLKLLMNVISSLVRRTCENCHLLNACGRRNRDNV